MSKAILVLNEMPGGCVNCALCRMENRNGYNDYICVPKNQFAPMAIGTDKPDWCPLREIPMKQKVYVNSDYAKENARGWNSALRALKGEQER